DYAQLLPYFGQRVKQKPRTELFANETVPGEGTFVAAVIVDDSIDCLIGQDLEISIGSEVFGELQDFIGLELYADFEGEQLATRATDDGEYMLRVPLDMLKDGELTLQMGLDSATLPR